MKKFSTFNLVSIVLGLAFLYLPILLLIIYSFNASRLVTVWGGFSTKWYAELFRNEALMDAAWVTIRVGLLSATVATVLGTMAAIVLVRRGRFRGRTLFSGMVYAPLVMPEVITGLSLLLLFVAIGMDRGFWTVTLAHITFAMCFVAVVVQSRLVSFDQSLEEAALDLGAPPLQGVLPGDAAGNLPGRRGRLDARLHAVARRPRHRELRHRARRDDAADEDLQPGAARRDAGDQRHFHADDRRGGDRRAADHAGDEGPRAGADCLAVEVDCQPPRPTTGTFIRLRFYASRSAFIRPSSATAALACGPIQRSWMAWMGSGFRWFHRSRAPLDDDEVGLLQHLQMLHHGAAIQTKRRGRRLEWTRPLYAKGAVQRFAISGGSHQCRALLTCGCFGNPGWRLRPCIHSPKIVFEVREPVDQPLFIGPIRPQ